MVDQSLNLNKLLELLNSRLDLLSSRLNIIILVLFILLILNIGINIYLFFIYMKHRQKVEQKSFLVMEKYFENLSKILIDNNQKITQNSREILNFLNIYVKSDKNQKYITSNTINNYNPEKMKEISNHLTNKDEKLSILLKAYKEARQYNNESFIPLTDVINILVSSNLVDSEEVARRLINELTRVYPNDIFIEDVRGKSGKQIAISL